MEDPAGGIEEIGTAAMGSSISWRLAEPDRDEVTSSGSTSFQERFLEVLGSISSSSSLVCEVWGEGIDERSTTLSRASPSKNEGVPTAGGLLVGIARF